MVGLASTIPTNLPPLHGKLIGRDVELQAIYELFTKNQERLVSLAGFGGVGKTTLAIHAAHALFEKFPGGLFFVDLTSIAEPAMILPCIAKVLGVQEIPNRELAETLRDFLANRSILFLLDNFEHLIEGAPIVLDFLMANPYVRILVTSRESLRLRDERVLPILPLENELSMQVFVQYTQTLNPHFRLTEDNTLVIKELCKKLDGIPLAIELAAMRTRMFTPQALLARLQSDLGTDSPLLATLTSGPRDMPERQQTLRGMIAWSYNLLTDQEKYFLQAAAFFRSGFEIQTLAQVTAVPETEAEQVIISLVDKNLLQPSYESQARFFLLESIREFALEQAQFNRTYEKLQTNFIHTYQTLMQAAMREVEVGDANKATSWMRIEDGNLLAALDAALNTQDRDAFASGIYLLEGFEHYWFPYCRFSEAHEYIDQALPLVQAQQNQRLVAIVYGLKGTLLWCMSDLQAAKIYHRQAAGIFEKLGDEKRWGRALNNLAANLDVSGEFEESELYFQNSLALARKTGDVWNELRVLCNFGTCNQNMTANFEAAINNLQMAFDLARKLDRRYELAIIEFNLACLYYTQDKDALALPLLEDALRISSENRYLQVIAFVRGLLGKIALNHKKFSVASTHLSEALEMSISSNFQSISYEILWLIIEFCVGNQINYEQAAILLGGINVNISDSPISHTLPFSKDYTRSLERIRLELGDEKFKQAQDNGRLMTSAVLFALARSLLQPMGTSLSAENGLSRFTAREVEVLRLLAQGKTNEEISKELIIVLKTVEKHVANVLRKLGAKNRTEAAAWVIENGLSGSKL